MLSFVFLTYIFAAVIRAPRLERGSSRLDHAIDCARNKILLLFIATVGTTITPWMQFYLQASIVDKGLAVKDYGVRARRCFVRRLCHQFLFLLYDRRDRRHAVRRRGFVTLLPPNKPHKRSRQLPVLWLANYSLSGCSAHRY